MTWEWDSNKEYLSSELLKEFAYITHWLASHFCFSLLSVSLLATLSIIYIFIKLAKKHTSSLGCTLKKLGKVYRGSGISDIYTTG